MATKSGLKRPLSDQEGAPAEKTVKLEVPDEMAGEMAADATPISKSGRVRKKTAKVLEMEEAEEMERIVSRQPKSAAKATPKVGKKSTVKTLLSATSPPNTAVARENSLEALKAQLTQGGFIADMPGSPEPGPPVMVVKDVPGKKAKTKKEVPVPLMVIKTEAEEEQEPVQRLKLLLVASEAGGLGMTSTLIPHPGSDPQLAPAIKAEPAATAALTVKEEPVVAAESAVMSEPDEDEDEVEITAAKPPKKRKTKDDTKELGLQFMKCEPVPEPADDIMLFEDPEDALTSDPSMELSTAESGSDTELGAPLIIDTVGPLSKGKKKPRKDKKGKGKLVTMDMAHEELLVSTEELDGSEGPGVMLSGDDANEPVYANTQQMGMKLMTSSEKKASKKKVKKGKKDNDPDKPKRRRGPTAYMLWCNGYRPKVVAENPGIDFSTISRRLGEIWQGLPEKEKMSWKGKAKRAANKLLGLGSWAEKTPSKRSTLISTGKTSASRALPINAASSTGARASTSGESPQTGEGGEQENVVVTTAAARTAVDNPDVFMYKVVGTSPVDAAAHLKLLGESLSIIGARLQEHQGQIAVQGSLSVLLDSLLCALGPLMCLTNQQPEMDGCPSDTHSSTLDNIAYFMPGIG